MIYFKTFIQMVIQDLSVLHAVVYTFARRMLGSSFWFSKVLTFILVLPPQKIPWHINVGSIRIFQLLGMLLGPKTELDTLAILGVYHLIG